MKNIKVLAKETPAADFEYWMKKTPEQRLDAVELLREQYYTMHLLLSRLSRQGHFGNFSPSYRIAEETQG